MPVADRAEFVTSVVGKFLDNAKLRFGDLTSATDPALSDASIYWDATRFVIDTVLGITHLGNAAQVVSSQFHIFDGGTNKPGILAMYDQAGTPIYLWVDNGKLRIHTAIPATAASEGVVVGTQT